MFIMTANGWKPLHRPATVEGHVPSLLEQMGIDMSYNPVAEMAKYANGSGRGAYFTYNRDGSSYQSRGAINPLPGMYRE
jgi:hypothetical protein